MNSLWARRVGVLVLVAVAIAATSVFAARPSAAAKPLGLSANASAVQIAGN